MLGGQCVGVDGTLAQVLRSTGGMTEYAWKFRCPGELFEPPADEVQAALGLARAAVAEIESRVTAETER